MKLFSLIKNIKCRIVGNINIDISGLYHRDSDVKIDEHCIVFSRDLNSAQNGPDGWQAAVIAHELLHLYGAEDFYVSSSRKILAKIYYPNDIMLSASYDIDTNTIDSATAFYIGWLDIVPNVLNKKG